MQVKSDDDKVLETYITHRKLTSYIEREARDVWMLFKTLTNNKRKTVIVTTAASWSPISRRKGLRARPLRKRSRG